MFLFDMMCNHPMMLLRYTISSQLRHHRRFKMTKTRKLSYKFEESIYRKLRTLSGYLNKEMNVILSELIENAYTAYALPAPPEDKASDKAHAPNTSRASRDAHDASFSEKIEKIKTKRKQAVYKEKQCEQCGNSFTPAGGKQKICQTCKAGLATTGHQLQEELHDELEITSEVKMDSDLLPSSSKEE